MATADCAFTQAPIARPIAQNGMTLESTMPASANHCQRYSVTSAA